MICPRECFLCTWEECVLLLDGLFCTYLLIPSDLIGHLRPVFPYFCLDDLSIDVSRILKSLTTIILFCISPFSFFFFFNIHIIYVLLCWVHKYLHILYLLLDWLLYHYVALLFVSYYSPCFKVNFVWYKYRYSSFFCFPLAWNIFFHPFTFSLCVSLALKWVCFRQHITTSNIFFWSNLLLCVFWSEHLIHSHLK